jgi:uncharacterized protein (DUF1697 family)
MITHIALLRAVNVAGNRSVAMAKLRELGSSLGFTDVGTLLQSGNLVFAADNHEPATFERLLETEVEKHLGLSTEVFVRTAKQWAAIIAANPFPEEAKRDPSRLLMVALKDKPSAEALKALQAINKGPEIIRADGRQAYIVYPAGIGRSKLTGKLIEAKLGTRATGRNWNTVLKLAALARG